MNTEYRRYKVVVSKAGWYTDIVLETDNIEEAKKVARRYDYGCVFDNYEYAVIYRA